MVSNLLVVNNVNSTDDNEEDRPEVYPACAVTRAVAKHANPPVNLGETFVAHDSPSPADHVALDAHSENNDPTHLGVGREQLMMEQENDPELVKLTAEAVTEEDMNLMPESYFKQSGVLMRKWRPRDTPSSDHWRIVYQEVVPKTKQSEVLSVAHASALAGHLGVNKTYQRILSQFFWPGLQKDVVNYCRSCHVCQMVGKPNQQETKSSEQGVAAVVGCMAERVRDEQPEGKEDVLVGSPRLKNLYILKGLQGIKLSHLTPIEQNDMMQLIFEFVKLFPDTPTQINRTFHDIDVGNATPIKQHPYHLNPLKMNVMQQEIEYMLQNDLIEAGSSEWSSPCVLVPKPDGTYRLCTDFRQVNKATKSDSYPIPHVDDCVDKVGNAKYVMKLDLLKGYWQVPLSNRAKEISAFVTPDGLFQYKVMPVGMKNAPVTFQHLINGIISGLEGCSAYIDDVVVYSDT